MKKIIDVILLLREEINNGNFIVTVRWSKGTDINSGCGQLAVLES